ncbi:MAG: LysM peptidoglycan-binding domain-containing protein [Candidatus Limnocylindrales bacterium]
MIDRPKSQAPPPDGVRAADASTAAAGVTGIVVCPYLLVPGASWRATRALREHRCMAIEPIEAPTLDTQRALCLTSAYPTCPRFEAALDARRARWLGSTEALTSFEARVARRVPRVAPIALDRPSAIAGSLSLLGGSRRLARIVLAAAMVGAAGLLLAARFAGGNLGGDVGSSPEPTTPEAVASPTEAHAPSSASPSLPVTATPSPSPATSQTPAKTAKPTAGPAATRRYRVKSGDTLSSIAARFGATVRAIKTLNGITDASLIRPGQVLRIP